MDHQFTKKRDAWIALLESDSEYHALLQAREDAFAQFAAIFPTLTDEQQSAMLQYIGISEELHLRETELCLFME